MLSFIDCGGCSSPVLGGARDLCLHIPACSSDVAASGKQGTVMQWNKENIKWSHDCGISIFFLSWFRLSVVCHVLLVNRSGESRKLITQIEVEQLMLKRKEKTNLEKKKMKTA